MFALTTKTSYVDPGWEALIQMNNRLDLRFSVDGMSGYSLQTGQGTRIHTQIQIYLIVMKIPISRQHSSIAQKDAGIMNRTDLFLLQVSENWVIFPLVTCTYGGFIWNKVGVFIYPTSPPQIECNRRILFSSPKPIAIHVCPIIYP